MGWTSIAPASADAHRAGGGHAGDALRATRLRAIVARLEQDLRRFRGTQVGQGSFMLDAAKDLTSVVINAATGLDVADTR
jgi:hypothetical protein